MLRRTKDDKESKASDEPVEEEEDPAPQSVDPLDERLAPLEEFRGKTDQWMKETSAQLARVATHVQQDEKRQEKLDSRLAEFEDRIQAMLTLTEALSAGENPFVKRNGERDGQRPEQETDPFVASEHPQDAPPRDHPRDGRRSSSEPPTWDREEEGEPGETQIVRAEPGPGDVPAAEDANESERHDPEHGPEPLGARRQPIQQATTPPSQPKPATRATPPTESPFQGHPNDPSFESYAPDDGYLLQKDRRSERALPLDESPRLDEPAAQEAEQRLILLQWAQLLARHMRRMDIEGFLETYVDTGWINTEQVAKVRALAADLSRHAGPPTEQLDREDLHVRTILLLSDFSTRGRPSDRRSRSKPPQPTAAPEETVLRHEG